MGLDMYLNGTRYIWSSKEESKKIDVSKLVPKGFDHKIEEIKFEIMYWRKANAIHKWFVENVQDGKDDCGTYDVPMEKLALLRDTLKKVLTDKVRVMRRLDKGFVPKVKETSLPTLGGFFYGGTDYDEFYWDELEHTLRMLDKIFENPEMYKGIDFEYHSSW